MIAAAPLDASVRYLAAAPDGRFLIAANSSVEESIRLWDGAAWQTLSPLPSIFVQAITFDPTGAPVVSGSDRIVRWTGTEWESLVPGAADLATDFATGPDGTLYAAGGFPSAGDAGVVRWTGAAWQALGAFGGQSWRLAVGADGVVYATGRTGEQGSRFARFVGGAWQEMGTVFGDVFDVAATADGIVVGGFILSVEGLPSPHAARWRPGGWEPLGTAVTGFGSTVAVFDVALAPDGAVVIGGSFDVVPGVVARNIARRDDAAWSAFGNDLYRIFDLQHTADGTLYAAAFRREGALNVGDVYRWDGTAWQTTGVAVGEGEVIALGLDADGALVASVITSQSGDRVDRVVRYDGAAWQPLGAAFEAAPLDFEIDADGALLAAGPFREIGGVPVSGVARWTGAEWVTVGEPGRPESAAGFTDLAVGGGALYGISDALADGRDVVRWTGTAWESIGAELTRREPFALAVAPDGDLYAGGRDFETGDGRRSDLARWDGQAWTLVGGEVSDPDTFTFAAVTELAFAADGALLIGGTFQGIGGVESPLLIRYDGERTVTTESTPESPFALRVAPNPARTSTALTFGAVGAVRVELLDVMGRRLAVLHDGPAVGTTRLSVPTAALAPGVYLVRLQTADGVEAARFTVAR